MKLQAEPAQSANPYEERQPQNEVVVGQWETRPLGTKILNFSWNGADNAVASIHPFHFAEEKTPLPPVGHVFRLGSLVLRRLPDSADYDCSLRIRAVRADHGIGNFIVRAVPAVLGQRFRRVRARLIVTLAVWGMAQYREFYTPQWSDIYVIARMQSAVADARRAWKERVGAK